MKNVKVMSLLSSASLILAAGQTLGVGISGTLVYKDGAGVSQPSRRVTIEIYRASPLGDALVGTTRTAADGTWSADVPGAPGAIGFFTRARAVNDGTSVSAGGGAMPYSAAAGSTGIGGGSVGVATIDTAGGVDEAAFAVADALQTSWLYAGTVRGASPAVLPCVYPESGAGTASFYSAGEIHIRSWRRFAWDVIGHEYGHYMADIDTLDANPGGSHSFGVSNITGGPGGKLAGVRLAWGEGLATFNGTAAQFLAPHPASPTTGDTIYTSLNSDMPGSTFSVNIETHAGSGNRGEGDEAAVVRILWDLADGTGGSEPHDRVTLGHAAVYSMINNDIPGIDQLDGLWNHLVTRPGTTDSDRVDYGAIFEEYGVSPHPIGGLIGSTILDTGAAPTFDWLRQNNDDNDSFGLIVFNADLTARLLSIVIPGDVDTYTLTAAQWEVLNDYNGQARFIIRGSDTDQYTTGSYWSDAYDFRIIPAPGGVFAGGVAMLLVIRRRR